MELVEFEEKEFEKPLYNQLEDGNREVWTPGQCFEYYFGIDYAGNISLKKFWDRFGYIPSGVVLNNYKFDYIWKTGKKKRMLPNFSLNLFIQAKRPYLHTGTGTKSVYNFPYFSFKINKHQQKVLEDLVKELGKHALIVYASPIFSTFKELYAHTKNGDMIENTSFPMVSQLSRHSSWNYYDSGNGIACSEPAKIKTRNIYHLINDFIEENRNLVNKGKNDFDIYQNLEFLEGKIVNIARENSDDNVQAKFFLQQIENIMPLYYYEARSYAIINIFCEIFNLDWYVLG